MKTSRSSSHTSEAAHNQQGQAFGAVAVKARELGNLHFTPRGVVPSQFFLMCRSMIATGFKKDIGRLIRILASTILVAVAILNTFAMASAHASPHADAAVAVSDVQLKTCTVTETAKSTAHGHHQSNACELPDERHQATCSVAVCCFQEFSAAPVLTAERQLVSVELVQANSAEVISRSELPHDRPPRSV